MIMLITQVKVATHTYRPNVAAAEKEGGIDSHPFQSLHHHQLAIDKLPVAGGEIVPKCAVRVVGSRQDSHIIEAVVEDVFHIQVEDIDQVGLFDL